MHKSTTPITIPVKDNNSPTMSIIGSRKETPANAQAIQLRVECVFFLEAFGIVSVLYAGVIIGCVLFGCGADG